MSHICSNISRFSRGTMRIWNIYEHPEALKPVPTKSARWHNHAPTYEGGPPSDRKCPSSYRAAAKSVALGKTSSRYTKCLSTLQARPPLRGSVGLGLEDEAQVAGLVGGNHNLLGHFAVGFMPGGDGLFAGRKGRQAEGAAFVGDGIV